MITAIFFKDSSSVIRGFSLTGHAEYGEYGSDIVCAAVSALSVNTANSIEEFTDDPITVNVTDSGLLTLRFDGEISDYSKLFIKSLVLGLENIAKDYNSDKTYLQILFKEV